tara:strand:- start:2064 stop:2606 length:543 start_codon:yes stop_codon:yes gene_type:complete
MWANLTDCAAVLFYSSADFTLTDEQLHQLLPFIHASIDKHLVNISALPGIESIKIGPLLQQCLSIQHHRLIIDTSKMDNETLKDSDLLYAVHHACLEHIQNQPLLRAVESSEEPPKYEPPVIYFHYQDVSIPPSIRVDFANKSSIGSFEEALCVLQTKCFPGVHMAVADSASNLEACVIF